MKRILLINNGYPSKKNVHYTSYIQSIKHCLEDAGYSVDLLVMDTNFSSKWGKLFQYIRYYLRLLFFSKYKKYDVVYIHNYPYSFLPMWLRFSDMKEVVIHWHGDDIFSDSAVKTTLNRLAYTSISPRFKHMAPSKYFAIEVEKALNIAPNTVFVSASGGVDTSVFAPPNIPIKDDVLHVGYASHLSADKGMDLVMSWLTRRDEIKEKTGMMMHFHCIAYGANKDKYLPLLAQMQHVTVHSPMPKVDMWKFYQSIQLFLFPTSRAAESLGSVSLEAMSCNVPVLGTDAYAVKEYVLSGVSGERFQNGKVDDMIEKTIEMVNKLDSYTPRAFVEKVYSNQAISKGYKEYFK